MSKMFKPTSVRRICNTGKPPLHLNTNSTAQTVDSIVGEGNRTKSLKYLLSGVNKVVVSDKYILDRCVLVLHVKPEMEKIKIRRALNTISEGNEVVSVNSVKRHASKRNFRGRPGSISAFKVMYIRFKNEFDQSVLGRKEEEIGVQE